MNTLAIKQLLHKQSRPALFSLFFSVILTPLATIIEQPSTFLTTFFGMYTLVFCLIASTNRITYIHYKKNIGNGITINLYFEVIKDILFSTPLIGIWWFFHHPKWYSEVEQLYRQKIIEQTFKKALASNLCDSSRIDESIESLEEVGASSDLIIQVLGEAWDKNFSFVKLYEDELSKLDVKRVLLQQIIENISGPDKEEKQHLLVEHISRLDSAIAQEINNRESHNCVLKKIEDLLTNYKTTEYKMIEVG